MCSGERSSSANGAMLARAAAASGWPISSSRVLSDWTINGPSVTGWSFATVGASVHAERADAPLALRGNLSSVPQLAVGSARIKNARADERAVNVTDDAGVAYFVRAGARCP